MKAKLTYEDPQVKEAIKDLKYSYQRIADLHSIEDPLLQFIAGDSIRFFEFRIANIEQALWKQGLSQFHAVEWKKKSRLE